jgi:tetratricopeptide (TPR) repeat protein
LNKIIVYVLLLFIFSSGVFALDSGNELLLGECFLKEFGEILIKVNTSRNKKEQIKLLEHLAEKCIAFSQYDLALNTCDKLISLGNISKSKKSKYYVLFGDIYDFKKDYVSSVDNYRKASILCKKNIDAVLKMGRVFLKANMYNFAERAFFDALALNKNSITAKKGLGDVFYRRNIYTTASYYYSQVPPNNYDKEFVVNIANCYYNLNKIDDAICILDAFTTKYEDFELLFLSAMIYIDIKKYSQAKDLLLKSLKYCEKKNNLYVYVYLAMLYDLTGETVCAKKMLDIAYSINSSYAVVDFLQSEIAYKMCRFDEAVKYANNAHAKTKSVFVKNQVQKMVYFYKHDR